MQAVKVHDASFCFFGIRIGCRVDGFVVGMSYEGGGGGRGGRGRNFFYIFVQQRVEDSLRLKVGEWGRRW